MRMFNVQSTLVLAVVMMGSPAAWAQSDPPPGPELIAVKFHADWCGSCKAMGDTFTDLASKLDSEPVLFVELDLTTSAQSDQAGYLMNVIGGEDIWSEYGGKTGFILLIDPEEMNVVGKLTRDMGFKEMVAAIHDARQSAS